MSSDTVAAASTPFSALPGAVGSPPQHYGNPLGEQKLLAAGKAIVDLSDRGVVSLTGPDRLTWLDSLTSQSLAKLAPGESAESLQLDPNGHVEFALRIIDDGDTAWLLVDAEQVDPLIAWLTRMKFMLRVEIADRTDEFATIGALSDAPFGGELPLGGDVPFGGDVPLAGDAPFYGHVPFGSDAPLGGDLPLVGDVPLGGAGVRVEAAAPHGVPLIWRDPWRDVAPGGWQYATPAQHPAAQWTYSERLVPRGALAAATALPVAGTLALDALRVAAWRPRLATEADPKALPHEFDWLRSAVHLNKGCYRGQETVAKVHNLGHPPRRLVLLHLDGSEGVLPAAGDVVTLGEKSSAGDNGSAGDKSSDNGSTGDGSADGSADVSSGDRVVGHITSPVLHFELGPIALALIKRSVDVDATLTVVAGGVHISAAQEVIVPVDAGATANIPRLPRLGAVQR